MVTFITLLTIVFVLSVALINHAWRMSPVAESGQIGSIMLAAGILGLMWSVLGFAFALGMFAARHLG